MKEGLDSGWQQMRDAFGDQADAYTTVLEKLALAKGAVTEEAIEEEGSFAKALQNGKVDAELLTTSLSDTIKTYAELLETMDEADPRYPYLQKDYEAFLKLNDAVADGSLDLEQYAEGLTEVSGREHLFNSLWNIMDAIGKVTDSVHEAFTEIFPPTSGEQIHSIAEGLDLMTKKLIITDESAANLKQTFKGIFAVVKVPLTAMTTLAKTGARAFGVLVDVLRPVGAVLLKVAGNMGSFVSEMARYKIYDNTSDVITPVGEKLTAEQWLDRYQWGRYTKMIVGGGIINGSVALVFDDEVERYRKAGCDFSSCTTDEDYLAAIEAFEDNPPMADAGVSDQTRIADALEDMVALSLPDDTTNTTEE